MNSGHDQNHVPTLSALSSVDGVTIVPLYADPITHRLKIDTAGGGTVTSVASADGSITVTNPTTTVDLAVVKSPKLTTGRTISISGDLTYTSPSFDGSGNVTAVGTLATVNSNVGTFGSATQVAQVTVNAKGLVTAAANVTITPAASSITGGAALTKVDDTNVTLTLGGTPATALLVAASITVAWTGTLAVSRGGTSAGTFAANNVLLGNGTSAFQVVAPGSSGNVLTSNGTTWSSTAPSGSATTFFFGDGSDGSITFDGSTTILGLVPSGNVYTLTRDIFPSAMTVNNGVTVICPYRIFCTGTLTNNGTIHNAGVDGTTGASGGGAGGLNGVFTNGGGGGSNSTGNAGALGSNTNPSVGASGGDGGSGLAGAFAGGGKGNATAPVAGDGGYRFLPMAFELRGIHTTNTVSSVYAGGAGGGSAGGAGGGTAGIGAGGGGGGCLAILANTITNTSGTISAKGGNGGAASLANAGGGGGGGGGYMVLVYHILNTGTETVAGGTGGAKDGTGVAGSNGTNGTKLTFVV